MHAQKWHPKDSAATLQHDASLGQTLPEICVLLKILDASSVPHAMYHTHIHTHCRAAIEGDFCNNVEIGATLSSAFEAG